LSRLVELSIVLSAPVTQQREAHLSMAIQVTCPGCLKRFSVADQHAGKEGPCPACKKTITIPKLEDQVVIHERDEGPKDSKGRSVLKTSRRKDGKFQPIIAAGAAGVALLALVASYFMGPMVQADTTSSLGMMLGGAALLGPFIAAGGYMFLRDDELEPYTGMPLYLRTAACGVVFAGAWLLFGFLLSRFADTSNLAAGLQIWELLIPLVVMFMLGLAAGYVSLDLEPASALMLFALFFICTGLLRLVMGLQFVPGLSLG